MHWLEGVLYPLQVLSFAFSESSDTTVTTGIYRPRSGRRTYRSEGRSEMAELVFVDASDLV